MDMPDFYNMTRQQIITYYKKETDRILANSQHPEQLRPLVNRMLLRLENSSGSVLSYYNAVTEMWDSFHKLNESLQTFTEVTTR